MSNETKFTRGPWIADGPVVLIGKYGSVEEDGTPAFGGFSIKGCPRPEANAHLISAAPELYEALCQAVTSMLDSGYSKDSVAVRACIEALATARGES